MKNTFRKLIKIISVISAVCLMLTFAGCGSGNSALKKYKSADIAGNASMIISAGDMTKWQMNNMMINGDKIVLNSGVKNGTILSSEIETPEFLSIITTMNVKMQKSSNIKIEMSVFSDNVWTEFAPLGTYTVDSLNKADDYNDLYVDINSGTLKLRDNKIGTKFRFKIDVNRNDANIESPKIYALMLSFDIPNYKADKANAKDYIKELKYTPVSNMIVTNGYKMDMLAAVLTGASYYKNGYKLEEFANRAEINGEYINPLGISLLLSQDNIVMYNTRITDISQIQALISKDIPVICRLKTDSKEDIDNALTAYKLGHYVAVAGFTMRDGKEYVIIYDSNEITNEKIRKEVPVEQFINAFTDESFIIEKSMKDDVNATDE